MYGMPSNGEVSTSIHVLGTSTVIVPVSSTSVTKSGGLNTTGSDSGVSLGGAAAANWPESARAATDITVAIVSVVALIISILTRFVHRPPGLTGAARERRRRG